MSAAVEQRLNQLWESPHTAWGELTTVDHKKLGKRYLVTAFAFLIIGGLEALVMRLQLSGPDRSIVAPETYDQLFTMHGMTMIFWYAQPILSGFSIYLIPLMAGARDLAFPRLNAFTYWSYLFSGLYLYGSTLLLQSPHGGWFAYVPFTGKSYSPGYGMDFYALSLIFLTISATGGAINLIVSIFRLRAPGMTISRMPLFFYSTLTVSISSVLSMPALAAACVFLELDRQWQFHFYDVTHGGIVLLWQQLFWFFGHPWVYIIFLPATGMISMIIPVFTRRPIVGYPYVAISTVMTGLVGFGVWLHHMFAVGMSTMSMSFFSAASMTISVFSAVQVFAWLATIWKGRPVPTVAFHFAMGFLAVFIIGGLDGIVTAIIPLDWQLHDTYFVVAHLHYVLVGTNMLPVFAAFYYWLPKMTGRMLNETVGKIGFWVILVGLNVTFFPMHILALMGMPRRQWTYSDGLGWGSVNLLETVGAFVLAFGILLSIINFAVSLRSGARAGRNPWGADTLEWSTSSPPRAYGSVHIPTVVSRNPLWDEHDEEADPANDRVLDQGRLTLASTSLDAHARYLSRMPEDSIVPLIMAVAMTGIFTALTFKHVWIALGFALACLVANGIWLWPKHRETDR
jgi:cytochrome c oxidase subunit 1/cytochrome c oxidase subunit I+III